MLIAVFHFSVHDTVSLSEYSTVENVDENINMFFSKHEYGNVKSAAGDRYRDSSLRVRTSSSNLCVTHLKILCSDLLLFFMKLNPS
jgi:hypothetical protein